MFRNHVSTTKALGVFTAEIQSNADCLNFGYTSQLTYQSYLKI